MFYTEITKGRKDAEGSRAKSRRTVFFEPHPLAVLLRVPVPL
jgi:hypothetical protein